MLQYGGQGSWVKYWARVGCWISPYYGPFSLGARFGNLRTVYLFNFPNFFGPRWSTDTASVDTEVRLYFCENPSRLYRLCLLNSSAISSKFHFIHIRVLLTQIHVHGLLSTKMYILCSSNSLLCSFFQDILPWSNSRHRSWCR
jgi:hypothetical protein